MSYEIVKKIRIEGNQVFVTSDSSNVFPKYYRERLNTYLTDLLTNEGEEAFNLYILTMYEGGMMQGAPNKWSRAIQRLIRTDEYKSYSWRISSYKDDCPIQVARKTEQFKTMLLNSLNLKPEKSTEKYIVKKNENGTDLYVIKVTTRFIRFSADKSKAKVYRFKEETERITNHFPQYQAIAI